MSKRTINAYAAQQPGELVEPFAYEREMGDHDVLIKITHCSVARGDVQSLDDEWGDATFPLVPGHEIVGVVEEAGAAVEKLHVGDRVGVGYQQAACFACKLCLGGNEQLCPDQKVIGIHRYGGWAEYIGVDNRFAFHLPSVLASAASAPLMSAGLTVFSAIARAKLSEQAEVAVLGAGGLGQLAIRFLAKSGHRVTAFSHSPEKQLIINRMGADFVDSSDRDGLDKLGRRFDFILSTMNARFDLNAYLRMLGPTGKFCFVAQPSETLPLDVGALYDNAHRTIYGSYVGSRSDMAAMLSFAAENRIESIVETMPFAEVNAAIDIIRRRASTRVVLER